MIMNSSSFIGRLSAGPLATRWGVDRMTLLSTTLCTAFIFCMLAIRDVGSVVGFALVYGFFSGVCEYNSTLFVREQVSDKECDA